MIKLEYMLLAEGHTIDQEDRVSLINIYDHMVADMFPFTAKKVSFAFSSFVDEGELPDKISVEIKVTDPKNRPILLLKGEGNKVHNEDDPDSRDKLASVVTLDDVITFSEPGVYKYLVTVEGRELACKELPVYKRG